MTDQPAVPDTHSGPGNLYEAWMVTINRAETAEAALQEARERMDEAAAHIESLLGHTICERGEMVLYAADINALGVRARQLRAAPPAQEEGR